jgi:hypothetical protein
MRSIRQVTALLCPIKDGALPSAKLLLRHKSTLKKDDPMSSHTESNQRIAADILIAAMESCKSAEERQYFSTPEKIGKTYQTIYSSVYFAPKKAESER